ncbi:MAG: putative peptidoglycan glycosyltransferase FtsW [Verrucomicrobium sp.]|nr:putative peptidoglycan glycosyltransferase FtsW [Verrucomicrobium sp.]
MNPSTIQRQVGYVLLVTVLSLMVLGIVMLLSISGKLAAEGSGAIYGALQKQGAWMILGGIACAVVSRVDYHWFVRRSGWILAGAAFLLLLVFVPHLGKKVNGSWRWISVGGMTLQPSEVVKWALVLFTASWLGRYQRRLLWKGVLVPFAVTVGLVLVLVVSRDLGSAALLCTALTVLLFVAGTPKRYLLPVPLLGFGGLFAMALAMPERRARLLAFLHPEESKAGKGYQVYQALIALGSGGPTGLGLGNSRQKMYYLPEAPTDFIFPIVGEEMGLWVSLAVVLAFLVILLCGGWITLHAPDPTGVLLGAGLTSLMAVQAMVNLCVVTALLPNKGLPLPFISYGGSNLLFCFLCVGMLFNLQRQGVCEDPEPVETILPQGRGQGATVRI